MIRNKIKNRFWDLIADQYIAYLKQKTDFKFKTAFDVGALYGQFVTKLNSLGVDCEGIEINPEYYNESVTPKVRLGRFDENYPIDKKYDLVCLTQMIYYVENPLETLNHVAKLLNTDGLAFVSTQDPSSPYLEKYPQIIESKMTKLLEIPQYYKLENFAVIDCTRYRPEIYLSRLKHSGVFWESVNYLKYHTTKPYYEDESGHHVFLLLRRKN